MIFISRRVIALHADEYASYRRDDIIGDDAVAATATLRFSKGMNTGTARRCRADYR